MIAKLINEILVYPDEHEKKKIVISNPTAESLKFNLGYKDLVIDEQPEYNPETQYLMEEYEETENSIIKHWIVENIESELIEE